MAIGFMEVDTVRLATMAGYLKRPAAIEMLYSEKDFAWQGLPGSQAQAERSYRGPASQPFTWIQRVNSFPPALVRVCVTAMAEQALAVGRLISDPGIGVYGILGAEACARSAVEIASKAWWLLDPSIGPRQRQARFQVEQLRSAFAAETLASEMGWVVPVDQLGISPTSARVKTCCKELGLLVGGNRRYPNVDGEQAPSATDAIPDLLEGTVFRESKAMVYRLLSATTHGTAYGVMRSFRPTEEIFGTERVVERFADHRIIESAASVTLEAFAVLMQRVVEFMGWDHWKITSFRNMVGNLVTCGPR